MRNITRALGAIGIVTFGAFIWHLAPAQDSIFSSAFLIKAYSNPPVVINEVDYNKPVSPDTGEFIELKNVTASPVDLTGFSVELINGTDGVTYQTINLPAIMLAAGDYFVICADVAFVANCDLDVSPDTDLIQDGSPDAVALFNDLATQIDVLSYDGDSAGGNVETTGVGIIDSTTEAFSSISRFPDGNDSNNNQLNFSSRCMSPGVTNSAFSSGCVPVELETFSID